MRHLLSAEGSASLTTQIQRRPLLAFDFDGTLAPIVSRPDDARVPMPIARRLKALSTQLRIAIISGRSVDDVLSRLQFEPTYVIGNHGAEDPTLPPDHDHVQALDGFRMRVNSARALLDQVGVMVEDKGASLALHYRLARDRHAASNAIADLQASLDPGLKAFGGKFVVNVVSKSAHDKAQALATLVSRCKVDCAVFVGDDINDEPVFARQDPNWLTVRVGRDDATSQAQFFIDSVNEIPAMLDVMLMAVST